MAVRQYIFIGAVCLLFFGLPIDLCAQASLGNWYTFSLSRKVGDKFELSLSPEFRTADAFGSFDRLFVELGSSYKISKRFDCSFDYRFSYFTNERGLENRFSGGIKYDFKKKPFTYILGSKYQLDYTYRNEINMAWRTKPEVRYRINKRWSPYAFGEILYRVSYQPNQFDRYRLGSGIRFSRKDHSFRFYYIWQQDFNVAYPDTRHILAVKYGWEWD